MHKMTDEEKKLQTADAAPPTPKNIAGEALRAGRTAKNISIEKAAADLRLRAGQLKAVEENNLKALPGMTYAIGFVRSYANYLGLNASELVAQFKADNSYTVTHARLTMPEPVAEGRMPDTMTIGLTGGLAILVLVLWAIFSGPEKVAEAPDMAEAATTVMATAAAPELVAPPASAPEAPTAATPAPESTVPAATSTPLPAAADAPPPPAETALNNAPAAPVTEATAPVAEAPKTDESAVEKAETAKEEKAKEKDVIAVKREKTRITLRAKQTSWVEITSRKNGVILKKVLKAGEEYAVPDQAGLSLVTANAGGLEVIVDGQTAPQLGRSGEIVRGVVLDPASLKRTRNTSYNN